MNYIDKLLQGKKGDKLIKAAGNNQEGGKA